MNKEISFVGNNKGGYVYPVVLTPENGVILVSFPDFPNQLTEADNESDAIIAAQEVLALCIADNKDLGVENPKPSNRKDIELNDDQELVYVHLWAPHLNTVKVEYVKKTLTLPAWLDIAAKQANVNFSETLAEAIIAKLGLDK